MNFHGQISKITGYPVIIVRSSYLIFAYKVVQAVPWPSNP